MTYQQQIKHPNWQKKRLEVLEANDFKCQNCEAKEEELHVHHPFYRRGAMIWEYGKEELECLCHKCHKDAHSLDEAIKKALACCQEKEMVLGFIRMLTAKTDAYDGPVRVPINSAEECMGAVCAIAYNKWEDRAHVEQQILSLVIEGDGGSVAFERMDDRGQTFRFTA